MNSEKFQYLVIVVLVFNTGILGGIFFTQLGYRLGGIVYSLVCALCAIWLLEDKYGRIGGVLRSITHTVKS